MVLFCGVSFFFDFPFSHFADEIIEFISNCFSFWCSEFLLFFTRSQGTLSPFPSPLYLWLTAESSWGSRGPAVLFPSFFDSQLMFSFQWLFSGLFSPLAPLEIEALSHFFPGD